MTTSHGCLVIVCGLPGSGKTTTAVDIAARRSGVRMSPDDWMTALGLSLWDAAMRDRIEALQWSMTQDLLRAGATVVVEWGSWARAERDVLRLRARELGAEVELWFLDVTPDELWRRIRARGMEDPPVQHRDVVDWSRVFEPPDPAELLLYDPHS
jgi:predicted kinase